jgi:hypothetical protein
MECDMLVGDANWCHLQVTASPGCNICENHCVMPTAAVWVADPVGGAAADGLQGMPAKLDAAQGEVGCVAAAGTSEDLQRL